MRFSVELNLEEEKFPKDKNRVILHILKTIFSKYDEEEYNRLYIENKTKRKNFTFSTYLGQGARFNWEDIDIPSKKIILNLSTSDLGFGIFLYNSFLSSKGLKLPIKYNVVTIGNLDLKQEGQILDQKVLFKTLSPICIREHKGDNSSTWYHSLNEKEGYEIFLENLKYQLLEEFGPERELDIEDLRLEVLSNKLVNIKHYDIVIAGNISILKLEAKNYILDYILKAGIGSLKSSGFGMLEIL